MSMQPKIAIVSTMGRETVLEAPDNISLANLLANYVLEKKVPEDWTGTFKPTSAKVFETMNDDNIVAEFFKGNLKETLTYLKPIEGMEPAFIAQTNADDETSLKEFSRNGAMHENAEVLYRKAFWQKIKT